MNDASRILSEIYAERRASNARYSLRAYARDLRLSAQQLSNVMKGRRGLGLPVARRIAEDLLLTSHQREIFLESLRARFAISKNQRVLAQGRLRELHEEQGSRSLELDLFKTIAHWHHLALVELIKISKGSTGTVKTFSRRLGISENEVTLSLGRLERLELITRTARGWKVNQASLVSDRGVPSPAVTRFHRQFLERSIEALAFQGGHERYGSSSLVPIRVKDVERAKKLIQKFRSDFSKELADAGEGEEVYGLSVQFFRLTQPISSSQTTPKEVKKS